MQEPISNFQNNDINLLIGKMSDKRFKGVDDFLMVEAESRGNTSISEIQHNIRTGIS